MAEKKYQDVTQLWKQSREAVQRNLGIFLFLSSTTILSVAWQVGSDLRDKVHGSGWSTLFSNSFFGTNGGYPHVGGGIIISLLALLAIVFYLMSIVLAVHAAKKDKVELNEVWADLKSKWLGIIGVEILTGFIIVVGLIAFIIPGIYLLGRVILAPYILIDQNTKIFEAVEKSWHLTNNRMGQVYGVFLFGIVLAIPNIVPIIGPILGFVLALSYSVAMPLRYFELKHHRRSPAHKKA